MPKQQKDDLEAVRAVIEAISDFEAADQERILRWAREKVGLAVEQPTRPPPGVHPPATLEPAHHHLGTSPSRKTDIKSFVESKTPQNDTQFTAVVAYYHQFEVPDEDKKD